MIFDMVRILTLSLDVFLCACVLDNEVLVFLVTGVP
jgi:hypothetical protein